MSLKVVFQHSSIYLVGDLIRRPISLLLLPFYTRYLTPADYGIIELLDLAIMVISLVVGLSAAGDALVRIYHEQTTVRNRNAAVGFVSSAGAMAMAMPLSMWLFHADYTHLIRLALLCISFGAVTETLMLYLQIKGRPVRFVCFSVTQTISLVGFNVYFIGGRGMGVEGFVLSKCIVLITVATVLLIFTIRETGFRFSWTIARSFASFGAPLILSSLSTFSIHFSDRFFVARFCTLADLGVYALAYKVGMLVSILVGGPFGSVWNATFYSRLSEENWRSEFGRTALYLSAASALVSVGLSVFARPVLGIAVTTGYMGAIALVPIIAFSYAIRVIGDFFKAILFISKRSRLFGGICTGCALLNLTLNAVLIPRYGIYGAALATLATWAAYLGLCWGYAQREHRIPYSVRSFATLFVIAVLVSIAGGARLTACVPLQFLMASALSTVFVVAVFAFGCFPSHERAVLFQHATATASGLVAAVRRTNRRPEVFRA